jgi:hypothetical protein
VELGIGLVPVDRNDRNDRRVHPDFDSARSSDGIAHGYGAVHEKLALEHAAGSRVLRNDPVEPRGHAHASDGISRSAIELPSDHHEAV